MSKICPMCGAFMKTNICEYCRYEMEVSEEKVQKEPEYQERQTFAQSNYINNNINNSINNNQPITNQYQYQYAMETVSDKNKILAFLLCLIFGGLGFHHFYVGKIGWGVVYFLTMGLFGFGWFIDLILILTGHFKDKDGLPLRK